MTAILIHFPPDRRGRILGLRQMAVPVGGFVAAGLLPILYHFGGLRAGLLGAAMLVLAFGFLFAYAAGPGRAPGRPAGRCAASFPVPLRWVDADRRAVRDHARRRAHVHGQRRARRRSVGDRRRDRLRRAQPRRRRGPRRLGLRRPTGPAEPVASPRCRRSACSAPRR